MTLVESLLGIFTVWILFGAGLVVAWHYRSWKFTTLIFLGFIFVLWLGMVYMIEMSGRA